MKFLADENCGFTLMSALTAAGHDVKSIVRIAPGISDESVFALAAQEGRILLTHDRDFGLIAESANERPPAIVLMRLRNISAKMRAQIVAQAIAELGESLGGHLTVIGLASIRSRPYKS
jgi:predicted nuclease of predicted toxin-antitoxin system